MVGMEVEVGTTTVLVRVGVLVGTVVFVEVGAIGVLVAVREGVLVRAGVGVAVGVAPPPPHVFSNIDTLSDKRLATTRSGLLSLLKSPTATERGPRPTGKLVAEPKPPLPSPSSTDTLLEP